ncbi:MAG: cobalamin biosynthesis protein, partial [Loktanella sp.]|nr:cobalamin biosynthesis protein [Loktanella sp.]
MALKPVVLALSRAGEATARRVATLLEADLHGRAGRVDDADAYFPNALDHARDLFAAGRPIVGVCAAGILIRAIAPLLADKRDEPPVLAVSDDGAVVVPLLGGHRGANKLAARIASELGATAAVTTAGDVALGVALDEPPAGYALVNRDDAKEAMATLLSGGGATVTGEAPWLADLPTGDGLRISVTAAPLDDLGGSHLQFAPQSYTLGVGCARNCPPEELSALVHDTLDAAGLSVAAIHSVSTIGLKADEPAILDLAAALDRPLRLFDAVALEAETPRLATPSDIVFAEVGTHGVSEAA